ncbi:helix-turn-helix domain-containing protein [Lactobacillus sp. S2-2]|uniref:helix-turn-helix domain-containing protein n=1 Tax=Lactobacillus sp. S2-2 TaxID=2692917 RepID=UPI001F42F56C|nr:helix-turn-helix transcriptional regulator [Lactobacillus sp. S2-2]MCF6515435.1 helix-turn-helix domain-containing protein [Lactobacillus sp. S2-2]
MTQNKIASLRKEKGWTQEELSEKSEVNVRTIQRLESGEDGSLDTLKSVANAFQIRISDLFVSLDETDKSKQIIDESRKQQNQIAKYKFFKNLYRVLAVIFFIIFMLVTGEYVSGVQSSNELFLNILYFGWLILWPIGFLVIYIIRIFFVEKYLYNKYPVYDSISTNKSKNNTSDEYRLIKFISILFFIILIILIFKLIK